MSEKTVESHLRRLFDRYGVLSRTELAVLALREGWVAEKGRVVTRAGRHGPAREREPAALATALLVQRIDGSLRLVNPMAALRVLDRSAIVPAAAGRAGAGGRVVR